MGILVKYSFSFSLALAIVVVPQIATADWLKNRFKDVRSLIKSAPRLGFPDQPKTKVSQPAKESRPIYRAQLSRENEPDNQSGAPLSYAPINFDRVGSFLATLGSGAATLPLGLASKVSGGAGQLFRSATPVAAVAAPLAAAIRHARNTHYPNAKPLPLKIIRLLTGIVPRSALKRARYVVGDFAITLPGVINGGHKFLAGNDHAMVVDDVIVFSSQPEMDNALGIRWWAHEVHHVYQYKVWGVDKFARNYIKDRKNIERRAERTAKKALARFFKLANRKK